VTPDAPLVASRSVATSTVQALSRPAPPPPPGRVRRFRAAIAELWAARELTANLVRRDLKVRHRGTFLGMLWSLTTPLLIVGLYYFIFKFIFRAQAAVDVPRPDLHPIPFAIYFFCGLTIWNLFGNAVSASTGSVVGASYLLGKVYFPKAILPLSTVLSSLVTFGFELAVLTVATLAMVGPPSWHILWLPLIVAVACGLAFGLALILSAVTVFLRDMAHFVSVFMQLWFWGTPVIYSLQFVSSRPGLVDILKLNPMTGVVVDFRNVVVLDRAPGLRLLGYDALVALVLLALGAALFAHWQRQFSEIV
jgi:ABC-type polysaccharide/polyol phosphate export permease